MVTEPTLKAGLFVAIDTTDKHEARRLIGATAGIVDGVKLGLTFYCAHGAAGVREVMPAGLPLFLDLKCHDIPNTVAGAVAALAPLRPSLTTIHAAGGGEMIKAAREQLDRSMPGCRLLAVTVLTSLDAADLATVGQTPDLAAQVDRLGLLACEHGAHGVVCAPSDAARLRRLLGPDAVLVVPGIRPSGDTRRDQKRVATPALAVGDGANHLVVGRPITAASDPATAARLIKAEMTGVGATGQPSTGTGACSDPFR